jgi:hypothetical protein
MKKIEHFKSMASAMKDGKVANATDVVADIEDPGSEPSISPDEVPAQEQAQLNKGKQDMAPNTWFHYDHPEHGKLEVTAHVHNGKAKVHSVGVPNDIHITPGEAGMDKHHMKAMSDMAAKHGPGNHFKKAEGMKKSEWTAEEIVEQALKNVKAKQDLKKAEATKMKVERDPKDLGSVYNEEQEVGNQNDIQEAAKRDTAKLNGKKLKEFLDKNKNTTEKAAKSPIEDK